MRSPLALALLASFALLQSTVSALPTSEAPTCAIKCFQKKIEEGEYLAPGAKGLHGLCSTPTWVKAYNNCLEDNCKEQYLEDAYLFGVRACTGQLTTSAEHGDSSTSRKLTKSCGDDCLSSAAASSTSSASSSLTDDQHPATCTCTETSHAAGPTQVYVGSAPSSTDSVNVTSTTSSPSVATASVQSQASPTSTSSGPKTLSIGIGATFLAAFAASLI